MKNREKKEVQKKKKPDIPPIPAQWLFISRMEIGVRDIKNAVEGLPGLDIEIWDEAGVLEITLQDKKTIDIERTVCDLGEDYGNAFLKESGAATLFYVTIRPESFSLAEPMMRTAAAALDGFFCGDTDDFTPRTGWSILYAQEKQHAAEKHKVRRTNKRREKQMKKLPSVLGKRWFNQPFSPYPTLSAV